MSNTLPLMWWNSFMIRWLEEAGRTDPIFPLAEGMVDGEPAYRRPGGMRPRSPARLRINDRGHLLFVHGETEVELARYLGNRRDPEGGLLLNGAGFAGDLMRMQTSLRERAQRRLGMGVRQSLLIPYPALESARIDLDSIRRVISLPAQWVTRTQPIRMPPQQLIKNNTPDNTSRALTFHWRGDTWRVHRAWNGGVELSVSFTPPNGTLSYCRVRGGLVHFAVHRLGAAVFTGTGPDGLHHTYLSAFDEQEANMYFLAQLPDGEKVKTYRDALEALKPPLVRQAEKEGRHVFRQGDIFAIETDLTLKKIRGRSYRRADYIRNGRIKPGISRRRAFMCGIYGTGHTADRKIETRHGTYVQGSLYHDPLIEEAGRTPEHRPVLLGNGRKWFLALRNSVPRDPIS